MPLYSHAPASHVDGTWAVNAQQILQDVSKATYPSKRKPQQNDVMTFDPRPANARMVTTSQVNIFLRDLQLANMNTERSQAVK